jgi:hypothetical protein
VLSLQQGGELVVLIYFLWASPKHSRPRKSWPFSEEAVHWLYDEVSVAENSGAAEPYCDFYHRILWSDGTELEIPCADVIVHRFVSSPQETPVSR